MSSWTSGPWPTIRARAGCQRTDVGEDVLKGIGKLESVNITQTILDMCIDHKLGETQDFTTKMESVSKTRLLTLLRGQRPEKRSGPNKKREKLKPT